jgi:hypothetical protein
MTYRRLMVVIFLITISPHAILLIVARMPRDFFIGMDLFHVRSWLFGDLVALVAAGRAGNFLLDGGHSEVVENIKARKLCHSTPRQVTSFR